MGMGGSSFLRADQVWRVATRTPSGLGQSLRDRRCRWEYRPGVSAIGRCRRCGLSSPARQVDAEPAPEKARTVLSSVAGKTSTWSSGTDSESPVGPGQSQQGSRPEAALDGAPPRRPGSGPRARSPPGSQPGRPIRIAAPSPMAPSSRRARRQPTNVNSRSRPRCRAPSRRSTQRPAPLKLVALPDVDADHDHERDAEADHPGAQLQPRQQRRSTFSRQLRRPGVITATTSSPMAALR